MDLGNVLNALTFFIDGITNQRFGRRRSRFDNIYLKGTGYLLRQSDLRSPLLAYLIEHIYVNNPVVNSGLSLRIFPWSSTGGV